MSNALSRLLDLLPKTPEFIATVQSADHPNYKVLVVDDSIATRAHIKALLQQQMFTVLVAAHGEEALVFLEKSGTSFPFTEIDFGVRSGITFIG